MTGVEEEIPYKPIFKDNKNNVIKINNRKEFYHFHNNEGNMYAFGHIYKSKKIHVDVKKELIFVLNNENIIYH